MEGWSKKEKGLMDMDNSVVTLEGWGYIDRSEIGKAQTVDLPPIWVTQHGHLRTFALSSRVEYL